MIVSRYAAQTRNLGGGAAAGGARCTSAGGDGERLAYTFGRASSVIGSRRSVSDRSGDEGSDPEDDFGYDDFGIAGTGGQRSSRGRGGGGGGGGGGGRGSSGRSSVEGRSTGPNPLGASGKKRSGRLSVAAVVPPAPQGTWAAFSRDHAPDLSSSAGLQEFRSGSGGTQRRSSGGRGRGRVEGGGGARAAVAAAPGYDGGGVPSPESSTVSGLTGWRRQRLQQRVISQRSSQRAAAESKTADGSEGRATRSGVKGLSALSRPAPAETSKNASTRVAAVTGTSGGGAGLSSSGRSAGGGGVSSSGSGSSRPGTSLKDALRERGSAGGGRRR